MLRITGTEIADGAPIAELTGIGIWNLAGENLIETQSKMLDVSSLPNGMYIVKSGNQSVKFIKE